MWGCVFRPSFVLYILVLSIILLRKRESWLLYFNCICCCLCFFPWSVVSDSGNSWSYSLVLFHLDMYPFGKICPYTQTKIIIYPLHAQKPLKCMYIIVMSYFRKIKSIMYMGGSRGGRRGSGPLPPPEITSGYKFP